MSIRMQSILMTTFVLALLGTAGAEIVVDHAVRHVTVEVRDSAGGTIIDQRTETTEDLEGFTRYFIVEEMIRATGQHSTGIMPSGEDLDIRGPISAGVYRSEAGDHRYALAESACEVTFHTTEPATISIHGEMSTTGGNAASRIVVLNVTSGEELLSLGHGDHDEDVGLDAGTVYRLLVTAGNWYEGTEAVSTSTACFFTALVTEESVVAVEAITWTGVKSLFE